jgi:hypothetical protein
MFENGEFCMNTYSNRTPSSFDSLDTISLFVAVHIALSLIEMVTICRCLLQIVLKILALRLAMRFGTNFPNFAK